MTQVLELDLRDVKPNRTNARQRLEGIDELAASIESVGQLQPILVRRFPGTGASIYEFLKRAPETLTVDFAINEFASAESEIWFDNFERLQPTYLPASIKRSKTRECSQKDAKQVFVAQMFVDLENQTSRPGLGLGNIDQLPGEVFRYLTFISTVKNPYGLSEIEEQMLAKGPAK